MPDPVSRLEPEEEIQVTSYRLKRQREQAMED
jgi:hypothetical protein